MMSEKSFENPPLFFSPAAISGVVDSLTRCVCKCPSGGEVVYKGRGVDYLNRYFIVSRTSVLLLYSLIDFRPERNTW